jgi:hypothetical protein
MPTKYIIMKSSRAFEGATAPWAYRGPTCTDAGVELGKIYNSKEEAQIDADKLTKHNPVGFVVLEMKNDDLQVQSS